MVRILCPVSDIFKLICTSANICLPGQLHCSALHLLYRFLQGPETDQSTVAKIRDAIREQREITVQLINYTKSGKLVKL